ncbi:DUF3606 domain-containing protein [Ideonella sp. BN130291]|uniref:DUF3606 domain-containing protein n=1 Tax=Ideonella sp. BN130291 TaxID=3112940 RepID=UPI002E26C585|nr:DUF3606 domain-containing protein [Ideonella sp. BN130291]
MTDNAAAAKEPGSHAEIDIGSPQRLAHWARELSVPPEALESAVKAVGPRVDRIKDYLTGGGAAKQSGG